MIDLGYKVLDTAMVETAAYCLNKLCHKIYDFNNSGNNKKTLTLTAVLYREDDVYVAECPEVGTASQGETIKEAIANLKEATEFYLEEFPFPETSPRLLTTFEVTIT